MARATAELVNPYPLLTVVQLELGKEAEAWRSMEKARARTLVDLLQATGLKYLTPEERQRESQLHRAILNAEKRLTNLARNDELTPAQTDSVRLALRHELDTKEAAYLELQLELAAKYPVQEGTPADLEVVQASLNPGTAMIGWVEAGITRQETHRWGYSLTRDGPPTWRKLDVTTPENPDIQEFLDRLKSRGSSGAELAELGAGIWGPWLKPLVEDLTGTSSLILVPSEGILGLPVEALVDEAGMYVGERYTISYAPSATVYAWLKSTAREAGGTGKPSVLLLGDPPYSEDQLQEMNGSPVQGDDSLPAEYSRLAASRDEINAIAAHFTEPDILLGPDASEQSLVDLADNEQLGSFAYIHLATHAVINPHEPRRSVLVLAQTGLPGQGQLVEPEARIIDGFLTPEEIVGEWNLAADLVVLSACETGLGRKVKQEGFIGFAHSFFQVGARSMLVSLWPVEDRSTSLLMVRFYENLTGRHAGIPGFDAGTPVPARYALQEAKKHLREYREGGRRRKYSPPYYWSPFVLIGGD
jgi:CHAT domain-containing protein